MPLTGSAPHTLADVGENAIVARIAARLRAPPPPAGPGDDAAVVAAPDGQVVVTTDVLVEGVHFRLDWSAPYDVGRRAAAASLADVAAMGAVPTALLVALAAPATTALAFVDGLADGLRDEAAAAGAVVVGGDLASSPAGITVAVTALGDLQGRSALTRASARPGDLLVAVGCLGWAAAGLDVLLAGVDLGDPATASAVGAVVAAHRRPQPPYSVGPALARLGATGLMDVSDGLLLDLSRLVAASGVAAEVDPEPPPEVREPLLRCATELGRPAESAARAWLEGGGDDHALLAAVPADRFAAAQVLGAWPVGWVVEGAGLHRRAGGAPIILAGHEHFTSAPPRRSPG